MEKRFFVEKDKIFDNKINIDGEEHLHLSKVLRLRVGDQVECFYDGSDIYVCQIENISKNNSVLNILSTKPCDQNPQLSVTLFQALPKLDKLELVTQKLTELGISCVVPFASKFCIAKENSNKIDRLKKIVVSACKQCGRTKLVELNDVLKLDKVIQKLVEYDLVLFANECEQTKSVNEVISNFKNSLAQKHDKKDLKIAYIVGSEGGFDKDEIEKLSEVSKSISLGKRILRAETAAISLGAIVCYEFGVI